MASEIDIRRLLKESLTDLTGKLWFQEKLAWAIRFKSSWERQMQADWAFQIDRQLKITTRDCSYFTAVEQGPGQSKVDIGLRKAQSDVLLSGVELKVWGNWYVNSGDQIKNFLDDVQKVDRYKFPAAAVAMCIFADPDQDTAAETHWRGLGSSNRVNNDCELLDRFQARDIAPKPIAPSPDSSRFEICKNQGGFKSISLWVGAHFNAMCLTSP